MRGLKRLVAHTLRLSLRSHPTWVRGLKQKANHESSQKDYVAPYVGAWIETEIRKNFADYAYVAPYVGAWIETKIREPSTNKSKRRTLRGCVD